MYINKKTRKQIDEITNYVNNFLDSKDFVSFVESKKKYICIKHKNECYCTNCKSTFDKVAKINCYIKCPKCQKQLLVKRTDNFCDKTYFMYLIKYEEKYIIRNYEIVSCYSNSTREMKFIITEYARQVVEKNGEIIFKIMINNMRRNLNGYWYISYYEKTEFWKPEYYITVCGQCFVDNNVLKAKYYDPKEIFDNAEVDVCDMLKGINENNYVLEMLTKAKLYNLATDYSKFRKGKFEKVFKIDRSFLKFMVINNIDSRELKCLQLVKIKDYKLIKYLSDVNRIEELIKYCKPYDLMKYHIKNKDIYMYLDYLSMAKQQKMDLKDKSILYPKKLKEKHDDLQHQIRVKKDKNINKLIKKRYEQIKKNEFQNSKFVVYPVKSIEELIDESSQQNNCVKTYAERIAMKKCDIYFMRLLTNTKKSLVTIEVRDNKIVQKRTKNNEITTKEQDKFLNIWEKKMLMKGEIRI